MIFVLYVFCSLGRPFLCFQIQLKSVDMVYVHLQSPGDNWTSHSNQSHYLSWTLTHKNFLKHHDFGIVCIFVTERSILMLWDTIKVRRYGLCPSTDTRGQLKNLTLRPKSLSQLNTQTQGFVKTPLFWFFNVFLSLSGQFSCFQIQSESVESVDMVRGLDMPA